MLSILRIYLQLSHLPHTRDWNRFNRKSNLENRLKIRLIVSKIRFDDSIFDFRLIESNRLPIRLNAGQIHNSGRHYEFGVTFE